MLVASYNQDYTIKRCFSLNNFIRDSIHTMHRLEHTLYKLSVVAVLVSVRISIVRFLVNFLSALIASLGDSTRLSRFERKLFTFTLLKHLTKGYSDHISRPSWFTKFFKLSQFLQRVSLRVGWRFLWE